MNEAIIYYIDKNGMARLRPIPEKETAEETSKWLDTLEHQESIHLFWYNKNSGEYAEYV